MCPPTPTRVRPGPAVLASLGLCSSRGFETGAQTASCSQTRLQAGRFLKGMARWQWGWAQAQDRPECPVSGFALQVEQALMQGAKAAGAMLSAVVESIRPKAITEGSD